MDTMGVKWPDCPHKGTIIHVCMQGAEGMMYVGHIVINDKVKEDSSVAIAQLNEMGVAQTIMLLGI